LRAFAAAAGKLVEVAPLSARFIMRMVLRTLFGLLVTASAAFGQAKLPEGVTAHKDLAYGDHERQKLDLFVPQGDGPFPVALWVHGGGWQAGDKGGNPFMLLLAKGYAVASTNYRFSQQAPFPAQIYDVKGAVRYLRANAKKYNLNPDAIGVGGASAGGHLVALLGTAGNVKELEGDVGNKGVSSKVQCVVDIFGPTDLIKLAGATDAENPITKLLGGKVSEKKDLAIQANPITHIDKDCPPFLILHGDSDKLVLLNQSELLQEALMKAKIPSELIVVKGAGHDGKVASGENAVKIAAFFDKHLMKK
jgi:acetyl esterase/lipase